MEWLFGILLIELAVTHQQECHPCWNVSPTGVVRRTNESEGCLLKINFLRDQISTTSSIKNEWITAIGQQLSVNLPSHKIV